MWNGNAGLLYLAIFNFSLIFFAGGQRTDALTYFQFFLTKKELRWRSSEHYVSKNGLLPAAHVTQPPTKICFLAGG
jgi:hypothetical protein